MTPSNLICPICKGPLSLSEKTFSCSGEKRHCYDVSASGYVNLLPPGRMNNAKTGDAKEMLRARVDFLSGGYYDIISNEIAHIIENRIGKNSIDILDAGCGEGYHLLNVTNKLTANGISVNAVGIDASKHGADIGAKSAKRQNSSVFFAAGNIFSLPVADKSEDVLISMFAPIPQEEALRVLRDNGILIVCASGVRHLWEMRSIIYDEPRENTKGIKCPDGFEMEKEIKVGDIIHLPDAKTIQNLFTMTPFYHRCPKDGRDRLMNTDSLSVTVEATLQIFKKKNV